MSRQDKFVANQTRDDLIRAKGYLSSIENRNLSKDWKPSMFIDEENIPHAFCLSESNIPPSDHGLTPLCGKNTVKRWLKR